VLECSTACYPSLRLFASIGEPTFRDGLSNYSTISLRITGSHDLGVRSARFLAAS
jgi:hypothetical protein